jgi:hypothetical protein
MKPKQTQPPRPLPLLRRAFLSSLDAGQARGCLEQKEFLHPALRTLFLVPEGESAIRVTGPSLHGDMLLAFQADGGAHALTADFRQADKDAAAELLAGLGETLQERRLRRPRRRLMGHAVGGYHDSVGHFLIWNAGMPMTEGHEILDAAIDAALGLRFRGFDEIGQAMQALEFDRLARVEGEDLFGADREIPAFLRRGMRADLRGAAAVRVLQDDRRTTLDRRVQTPPDEQGWFLRLHHRWDEERRRHVIGWVSEGRGTPRRRRAG